MAASNNAYPVPKMFSAGTYVFRFNGFSMANDTPYYIVGMGRFTLSEKNQVAGILKSSITQIAGLGAQLEHSTYTVTGTWGVSQGDLETATITFSSEKQEMTGTFDLVEAGGPDRYWLISTGAKVAERNGISGYTADEVVSGEAIRVA